MHTPGFGGGREESRLLGRLRVGVADGRIILIWMVKYIMDWINVTVAAFCEYGSELCAAYVCSVTVLTTLDLYLQ